MSTDARFAAHLAEQAGQLLLDLRSSLDVPDGATAPPTGKALGKLGDVRSNAFLLQRLAEGRPADAVLSEEAVDNPARLAARRVWIIDPLDGTREFGMPGRTDWAVHVALWEASAGITAAAVAQPALGAVYASDQPVRRTAMAAGARPSILVSDSRPPAFMEAFAAEVGADVAPMGSAGAKAMAVVRGDADAYVHAGGQWEWDSAAPVGVALAAGLHASRIDGTPLRYNEQHPYLPDLLICRPELAEPFLRALTGCLT